MRRLLFALFLLAALPAAAGSYTITTTAGQDTVLARALTQQNRETCLSVRLPAGCTNAQAQAIDSSRVVYADIAAMLRGWAIETLAARRARIEASDVAPLAGSAFAQAYPTMTDAQKRAACIGGGLLAGCLP